MCDTLLQIEKLLYAPYGARTKAETLIGDVLLQKDTELPVVRLSDDVEISHHICHTTPFLSAVCSEDVQGK